MTHTGGNADDPLRIGGVGRTARAEKSDAVAPTGAEATHGVESTSPAEGIEGGSIEAVADALATGAIDADAARTLLIDRAVRAQLPAGCDPALVAEVRAEVEALLENDPLLESLLHAT